MVIDCNYTMHFYDISDLLEAKSPSEDQLRVMRVDLIQPPLLSLDLFSDKIVSTFDFH